MNNISGIVTTYNDEASIIDFLDGIMSQSHLPDELVIVDGGSNDNTVELIKEYAQKAPVPINLISDGKRYNISEGFNLGINLAVNDWVLIMGTGNSYDNDFIKKLLSARDNSTAKVIYSSIIGVEKTKFAHLFNQYFLRGNKPRDLDISNHGVLIHKSVFAEAGYFWEHYIYAGEDLEYFARVRRRGIECKYVKDAYAYWDTPQTWKEYLKKMKANSIADWQMFNKKHIWKTIIIQIIGLLAYIALACVNWRFLLLAVPFMVLLGIKKKTSNVFALLLGTLNRYIMVYYYIINRKYADEKYHVPKQYEM